MEASRDALRTSSNSQAEPVTCSPEGRDGHLVPGRPPPQSVASADEPRAQVKAAQLHPAEEGLQPVGNLPEIMKISQQLEATKVQESANTYLGSETHMENKSVPGCQNVQTAREPVAAGQEKPSDMPLPSERTAEEKMHLITEKDLAAVWTGEMQSESLQATINKAEEVHTAKETSTHRPSVTNLEAASRVEGWAQSEDFSAYSQGRMQMGPERRLSKEAAASKHVEFQGVEILWLQKAEDQSRKKHLLLETTSVERKAFPKTSSHSVPLMVAPSLVTLPDSAKTEVWEEPRVGSAHGAAPLALLDESGEDDVFVKDKKNRSKEETTVLTRGHGR
ncbi:hypothetical protein CIB84_000192 [Bambusicola thoracicus]|uniref:Uncharacterized protein n=1 Tax=Bambusicola thoracicus TaxID=9083 RepID=A0A2P4TI72_BAMTH|nr:hypothetical protein CIB84_000192 [Bambusicola thoracicus]